MRNDLIKKIIGSILLPIFWNIGLAQSPNLIPNSGFEKIEQKPNGHISTPLQFDSCVVDWQVANLTTPDLVANAFFTPSAGEYFGDPHQGSYMLGLINSSRTYTEYASCQLNAPLTAGETYEAKFWMRLKTPQKGTIALKEQLLNSFFGMLLTKDKIFRPDKNIIYATPQINIGSTETWINHEEWTLIRAIFKPQKSYSYLTIGQFVDASAKSPLLVNGYVLIDDLSIRAIEEEEALAVDKLTFEEEIYFESGESTITTSYFPTLDSVVAKLQKNKQQRLDIIGHTDDVGSVSANFKLANLRARAVYDYLIAKGIDQMQLKYYGVGDWVPASTTGRAKNRRVEFFHMPSDKIRTSTVHPKEVYKSSIEIAANAIQADWNYAFIGNYEAARLARMDDRIRGQAFTALVDSLDLNLVDAKNYILEQAASYEALFFNEAHHIPRHRLFVTSLLKDLYKLGYRHFGLEALSATTRLTENQLLTLDKGYYIREPLMAELIREALKLGFQVFGYEATKSQIRYLKKYLSQKVSESPEKIEMINPDGTTQTIDVSNGDIDMNARDLAQAINIQTIRSEIPDAKILIHAGFGHIKEAEVAAWKPMALQFQILTGINPLTIDQTTFAPMDAPTITTSRVLLNSAKQPYVVPDFDPFGAKPLVQTMDVHVVHAAHENWQLQLDKRSFNLQEIISKYDCPCLVHAYAESVPIDKAVPHAVVEYDLQNQKPLILPIGKYRLLVRDQKGAVAITSIIVN